MKRTLALALLTLLLPSCMIPAGAAAAAWACVQTAAKIVTVVEFVLPDGEEPEEEETDGEPSRD